MLGSLIVKRLRAIWQSLWVDVDRRVRLGRILGMVFVTAGFILMGLAWNGAMGVLWAATNSMTDSIYELNPETGVLFSEDEAGSGVVENTHTPNPDAIPIFGDSILYVNTEECTSCTACYQTDVCPVGAIYSEEDVPDGATRTRYNPDDPNKGHDHSFFTQLSRDVFAD